MTMRLVSIARSIVCTLLVVALAATTSSAFAGPPPPPAAVPEIDPGSAGTAVALAMSALALLDRRRTK
jgi:hypothetical protein